MLQHLLKWFGKIYPVDLENNKTKLQEQIDLYLLSDVYFKQVDNCLQYTADTETSFTQKQLSQMV